MYVRGILRFIKELFRFNFVHYKVKLGKNVRIDHFTIIEHNVEIGNNTWIGSWVHIRPDTKIGHDSEIRNYCYISGHKMVIGNYTKICQKANIGGGIKIGNRCFIAPGISTANTKRMDHQRTVPGYIWECPVIEDGVQTGTNVTILPGVTLAKDCYIGGGAVVTKDTESYGVYVGNPARKIKELPVEERLPDILEE